MYIQFKVIKRKSKTPVFELINPTHYQGRKGTITMNLIYEKFSM